MTKVVNSYKHLIASLVTLTTLLVTTQSISGKNYYFSTSTGDDTRTSTQAQNPLTPWKTITKLNSFFVSLAAGDSVLFRRGESFYGSIKVAKSGTFALPIIIGAYGTGAKPIISGFTTLTTWTSVGNGIYQCAASSCKPTLNMVTVNGIQKAIGRYPNYGYLKFESHIGTTSITDNELTGSPNWTGAEVVIKKRTWMLDINRISSHSTNTIYCVTTPSTATEPKNNYGYFIQDDLKTLDLFGEWFFDQSSNRLNMFFGLESPTSFLVRASTIDTAVYIYGRSFITFDNLSFEGANVASFYIVDSPNITVKNCSIDFSGTNAITILGSTNYFTLSNSSINHTNNNGITIGASCSNAVISSNSIKNTALIPGMGVSGTSSYTAIVSNGPNALIEKNKIDSIGYIGINFHNNNSTITKNYINYFCSVLDDGSGIYTSLNTIGNIVSSNIVLNGIGAPGGTAFGIPSATGIYCDDQSTNVTISNNTVSKTNIGIFVHNSHEISISGNTLYDNDIQLDLTHDRISPNSPNRNVSLQNNIFFTKSSLQIPVDFTSYIDEYNLWGIANNNYFVAPFGEDRAFRLFYLNINGKEFRETYSLNRWKAEFDLNAKKTPITLTNTIKNTIGTNRVTNGNFDVNTSGISRYYTGTSSITWNNTSKLTGGSAKHSFSVLSTINNESLVSFPVGAVEAGKNYLLKFSSIGINENRMMKVLLIESASPYRVLNTEQYVDFTNIKTDNELIISPNISVVSARVYLYISDAEKDVYFDNIQFFEVDATILNRDDHIRFEYNASNYDKTIALDVPYIGTDGTSYINSIKLSPYTSAILIKNPSPPLSSINLIPTILNQSFQLNKITTNGTIVGTVQASDPNAGQILTYTIVSGNTSNAFAINSVTGAISVANYSLIAAQTSSSYSLVIKVQDNGIGLLSSQATITINLITVAVICNSTGNITYQVWNNIGSSIAVSSLTSNINYPNNPSSTTLLTSIEGTTNLADNFGARIVGYICAPATGSYTFWIAGNNNCELWLSTDDQSANVKKIAYHTDFTNSREWNKYATQKSVVINLIQGKSYYVEVLQKEATYEDNLAVGWLKPGQTGTVPSEIIPGSVLSPLGTIQTIQPNLVSSLSLQSTSNVNTGSSVMLLATILPENADNTSLIWTSSNQAVLTVNSSGIITGIASGTAIITATTTDGSNKSATCLVTVASPQCSATGNITYQVWNNIGSSIAVSSLTSNINYPNNPSSTTLLTSIEGTTNLADNFGARIVGYICAPATGSYTFWIAGNNNCELWLSTDDQSANVKKIAYHTDFTNSREWNKYATQKSVVINLIQGKSYYVEVLQKEATYEDNLAVGWLKPGQTGAVPSEIIPGSVLSPLGTIKTIQPNLVSSLSLQSTSNVNTGSSVMLLATILPENADNTSLIWTSSNQAVLTVNSSGIITGIASGTAIITATTTDGSNKSATCLVTVASPQCSATGNITYQVWNNIGSSIAVSSLTSNINYPNNPSSTTLLTSIEGTTNLADNFGARIVGYICAPATGSYTFWIAGNNNCELWLSTDDQSANVKKIAYHTDFTNSREWNKYATQKSVVINLIQGKSYYVEVLQKEATYEDNLAVGWLKPGQTGTVPSEIIPGSVLSPLGTIKSAEIKKEDIAKVEVDVKLSVYPNPLGNDELNIKIENLSSEATLEIFSITGVKCYSGLIQNSDTYHIGRILFNSGIYIIRVINSHFVKTSKLIVK